MNMNDLPACVRSRKASPAMSDRYVHVNTVDVIEAMRERGFTVASVKADKARQRDPRFVRHVVDFRAPGAKKVMETEPRILFVNSHNGRTKARILAGMFRFICENGLVVGDVAWKEETRHSGDSARQIIDRIAEAAKATEKMMTKVHEWSKIEMSPRQQKTFAKKALDLRFGEKAASYDETLLLVPRRVADEGDNLWSVFNRVQENGTRGGLIGRNANGRQVQSRTLTGIQLDIEFNRAVWDLAESVAASK